MTIIYNATKPKCTLDDVLEIVQGPDFPTGGIACGKDEIRKALDTGKGKVVVKSKYHFNVYKLSDLTEKCKDTELYQDELTTNCRGKDGKGYGVFFKFL